ncbi:BrnA antitoxin of type II toxin-antitoxin system [Sphingomonadaceae bacterium]
MNVNKLVLNPELVDLDDAPELTDEWFDKATFKVAGKVVRRGRPKGSNKEQVAMRLDRDIIQHFKEGGTGWQSRINAALKELIR